MEWSLCGPPLPQAHVHGSVGVHGVPALHILHLRRVHVLHLQ